MVRTSPRREPEQCQELCSRPEDVAVVAKHEVGVVRIRRIARQNGADDVALRAAHDHGATAAGLNVVDAADVRSKCLHHPERDRQVAEAIGVGARRVDRAAVTEHHVRRRAAGDRVVALAADHDRPARPDRDRVVAAGAEVGRRDEIDVRRVRVGTRPAGETEQCQELGCRPKDVAVVAEHEVRVVRVRRVAGQHRADRVVACPAENDRAAGAGLDVIVPADVRSERLHHPERDRQIAEAIGVDSRRVDRTVVAQHHRGR